MLTTKIFLERKVEFLKIQSKLVKEIPEFKLILPFLRKFKSYESKLHIWHKEVDKFKH